MNKMINLTSLYKKYIGTSQDMSVCFNEHTYKPNMDWENDWLSYIFCAFKVLKTECQRKYKNILIIGSGSGADAIGAIKIFAPNNITITDIMSETLPVIKTNVEKYAQNCKFEIIKSDLFENVPLQKYDLIYENLPNIPSSLLGKDLNEGINSSSYISDKYSDDTIYSKYLLDLHKTFLRDCKKYLAESGIAICNIGIRFPIHIYEQLFEMSGFSHRILVMGIKEQTEAIDVLSGYYTASVKHGTTIYYYRLDKIDSSFFKKVVTPSIMERKLFIDEIENAKVTIDEAINLYNSDIKVGHLVFTTEIHK